jgi:integrase
VHLEQLPSKSWRVTVTHGGERRRGTRRTKIEAEQLGGRFATELGAGIDDNTTLGEFIDRHVEAHTYAVTTRSDYRRVARRLGDRRRVPIATLTTGRLVALYASLAADGWQAHRISKLHELISSAFARALRFDEVSRNPATGASPGRPPRPAIVPPTDGEVARLEAACPVDLKAAVILESSAGMRRGELVAVQRGDFDLDEATLSIRRAAAYTPETGLVIKELKNGDKGYRVIGLDAYVMAALRTHLAQVAEHRLAAGAGPLQPRHYVFSRDLGVSPWFPDFVTKRWGKLRASLELDHVKFGHLRHYVATSMLTAGESPQIVAGRLGHDPVTLQRRYWHFIPAADRDAADRHAERLREHRQAQ